MDIDQIVVSRRALLDLFNSLDQAALDDHCSQLADILDVAVHPNYRPRQKDPRVRQSQQGSQVTVLLDGVTVFTYRGSSIEDAEQFAASLQVSNVDLGPDGDRVIVQYHGGFAACSQLDPCSLRSPEVARA